jgi:hypothetical protein
MTEPLTILGIILFIYVFICWVENNNKTLALLAGAVLGGVVLIRIEILALIPILGLISFLVLRERHKTWLTGSLLISLGLLLMIIPWMTRNQYAVGTFSVDQAGMLRNTVDYYFQYLFHDQTEQSLPQNNLASGIGSQESEIGSGKIGSLISSLGSKVVIKSQDLRSVYFFDHLANNLKQYIYFLPDGHQPLLTLGSLKDMIVDKGAADDLENDSFSERYLERYVRSLPYWWPDWNGNLIPLSYLPIVISISLVSLGGALLHQRRNWVFILFLLALATNALVYALIGRSGGRFIYSLDWMVLSLYGIGLSRIIEHISLENGRPIPSGTTHSDMHTHRSVWPGDRMLAVCLVVVFCIGLALPLTERFIPTKYTDEKLEQVLSSLPEPVREVFQGAEDSLYNLGEDPVYAFGRALYPRFFKAGRSVEDNRHGQIPDTSYKRVEYYLLGTDNIWATLPVEQSQIHFPHDCEVLILGTYSDKQENDSGSLLYGRYLKAEMIYLFPESGTTEIPAILECSGDACLLEVRP